MSNPLDQLQQIPDLKVPASTLIYNALREAILANELPGGTQLVEAQLAERFNVSKTPVREALQRLVHSGLADSELAKGVVVHTLTEKEVRDLVEMRLVIEPMALEKSVPHLTKAERKNLRQLLENAYQAMQDRDFVRLSQHNSDFHWGLCAKAPNQLLLRWLSSLNDKRRLITMQGWAIENRSELDWQQHMDILNAVEASDSAEARRRLENHIRSFAELILAYLEQQSAQADDPAGGVAT